MKREKLLAWAAFAVVCLVWGTTYLAIRIAIETLPTFLLAGARFTLGGVILLAICLVRGEKLPRSWRDWKVLAAIGFLMVVVANGAVVWAEHYIASGLTALLVATSPFWMASIELIRDGGERISSRKVLGMIVGFAGVAILVAPELRPSTFNPLFIAGAIVVQFGSIAWNFGSVLSKYHPPQCSPLVSASLQMLLGGLMVGIIGLAAGEADSITPSGRSIAAFLYLTLFGSVLAYTAYVYALSKLSTATVSLYSYINPAVAVLLGWAILDEPIGWRSLVSMFVILCGIALVQSGGKPAAAEGEDDRGRESQSPGAGPGASGTP